MRDYNTDIEEVGKGSGQWHRDHDWEIHWDEASVAEPSIRECIDNSGNNGCVDETNDGKLECDWEVIASVGLMLLLDW